MPDVLRDMMLQIRDAVAGKGKDMVASFKPNITERTIMGNGMYGVIPVAHSLLKFQFWYDPLSYFTKISATVKEGSWESQDFPSTMLESYMQLVKRIFPMCRENDLVCISDTFLDWDEWDAKELCVLQKHVLVMREKQMVTIKIMQSIVGKCMEMEMNFHHMSEHLNVVFLVQSMLNHGNHHTFMKNTPGLWTIVNPSERHLAVALGLTSKKSPLKNIEETLLRDIAYMSMKDGINPWIVDIHTPESAKVRVIYVIKAALEHGKRQFERMLNGEVSTEKHKKLSFTIKLMFNQLKIVHAAIDDREQHEHVKCIPPGQETHPHVEQLAGTSLCLTCGLRIRSMPPNRVCLCLDT